MTDSGSSMTVKAQSVIATAALGAFLLASLPLAPVAAEEPYVAPMQDYARTKVQAWIDNPAVIEAVKAQNQSHADITQGQIDGLDAQWRNETGASSRPLIEKVLNNALSRYLAKLKNDEQGLITEIFVMDNKGLNVAISDVTSDYWQGDEAKWKKTYLAGPDAIFVDEIEQDESTQMFQSQLSMTITDPASGEVIGAITVGINVDELL